MHKSKILFLSCLSVLAGCDNYQFEGAVDPDSNGEFVTKLPANTIAGDVYPVSFVASMRNGPLSDVNSILATENMSIESSALNCLTDKYGDEDLCTVSLRAKPLTDGLSKLTLNIGNSTFSNQTNAGDNAIIGYMHSNTDMSFRLDKDMFEVGTAYPVHFVFVNLGNETANNVNIQRIHGSALTNVKSTCSTSLLAGEACYINGDYTPKTNDGGEGVQYRLTYDEGQPVIIGAKNMQEKSRLVGQSISKLPLNIALNTSYDVEYKFKNIGDEAVNNLTTQFLAPGLSKIRFDSCMGNSLSAGESCSITASIVANEIGTVTALVAVNGDGGVAHYATATSNVVEAPVVAHIDNDIPQSMALDDPYYYLATFTNESKTHDATGVRFSHLFPEHFDVLSNTCTDSTLKAEESCHISVSASAKQVGVQHYSSYLSFDQGTAVMASSTLSQASNLSINSQVDVNFPPNMVLHHSYPFHVTLTNTSALDTAALAISSDNSGGVTIAHNTCVGVLTSGSSCSISGEYYTTQLGPTILVGSVEYGGKSSEKFTISGEVVAVPVIGHSDIALPHTVALNNSYPFSLVFQNLSSDHDATNVDTSISSTASIHITSDTCQASSTLHAGESCRIEGNFIPDEAGQQQVSASFRYNEGNEVKIHNLAMVSDVVLSSKVEGVSELVGLNETYTLIYTFRNESLLDATGILVNTSSDLTINPASTCGSTLNAGQECTISTDYSPTVLGNHTYELTLNYVEGDEIKLTQPVKVVDTISLAEMVFEDGSLEHAFDANNYFSLSSSYGFTMQDSLQTVPVSGNPQKVVYSGSGSTPLAIDLTPGLTFNFQSNRANACSRRTMNTTVGCQVGKLPKFVLKLTQTEFNSIAVGEHTGDIYVTLTQSNNSHIALFKLPIRVKKL
ncbi:hypothetical protein [Vibrio sp. TBV020]|uniref:hypothetical protein n=1 Tax=Vibrio sp. TBV020 TaxID=3137398 RepID=UPI0038CD97DA